MNLQSKLREFLLLAGLVAVFLFHCSTPRLCVDGPTTQTGNGMITGIVYQSDGKTAAGNAFVYIRKKNLTVDVSDILIKRYDDTSSIVKTDSTGNFSIDSIDTGVYTIECTDGGNNFAIIDSVAVRYFDSTVVLSPLSLKPAGSIKGAIRLSEGGDPRKVFVLIFGIDRFAKVDTNGAFQFRSLAEGRYDVRVLPALDHYAVFDTLGIIVKSGDTNDIGVIQLCYTGLPTIRNLSATYDTLKQWVTVRWSRPNTAVVKSFNIYRRNIDPASAIFTQLNFFPIVDTVFIDSLCEQNRTYEYFVTAVDSTGTGEGAKSAGGTAQTALYDLPPKNVNMLYDTLKQAVTLRWSNPDTALIKSYNVYRRNVRLNEKFWTPFNNSPIVDTFFIDSTFILCPNTNSACDDSAGLKGPIYEYCVAALIKNVREGKKSAGESIQISLKYLIPTSVQFNYDTLRQMVTLHWSKPDTTLVNRFNIFRRNKEMHGDLLTQINAAPVGDTFFIDSTAVQSQTYEYCVASIVKYNRAQVKSLGVNVRIAAYLIAADSMYLAIGSAPGNLSDPNDVAVATNGDMYLVDQGNARIQVFDSTMRYKRQFGNGVLHYPLKVSVNNQGRAAVANYDTINDRYSIFLFDSSGAPIEDIPDSTGISDLDARDSVLYVLTAGGFVSAYSYDGSKKRSWQISFQDNCQWIVTSEVNKIFVSTGVVLPDKNKVVVYDSLGNKISSITFPYYPFALAFDDIKQLLYVVCYNGKHESILRVVNKNFIEVANYKIQSDDQNISIGLQKNGAVFLVLRGEGKILKLKSLL